MKFSIKKLKGSIYIPASKSSLHRILFFTLLKPQKVCIATTKEDLQSEDVKATLNILKKLNCRLVYTNDEVHGKLLKIDSFNISYSGEVLDCQESGTTIRLVIPILLYLFGKCKLKGSKKLLSRPFGFYKSLFLKNGLIYQKTDDEIYIKGNIKTVFSKNINVDYCDSSQFITGLMFVLPLINPKCEIVFTNNMESVPYLEMTADVLAHYNIKYKFIYKAGSLKKIRVVSPNIKEMKSSGIYYPEPDFSSMAFWLVANELGAEVTILNNLTKKYSHPDKYLVELIKNMPPIIDVKDCPDLLPILIVWTSFLNKETKIINFDRNRLKESNRVEGMIDQFNTVGGNIKLNEKEIKVYPVKELIGGKVNSLNDHRIAMAFAIASLKLRKNKVLNIENFEAINKSYPQFYNHFEQLMIT